MERTELIVTLVTVPTAELAEIIANKLVTERLAACVNILPGVRSIYSWKGKVEEAGELLLLIKTKRAHYAELEARIRELHSYDTPEIVAIEACAVFEKYLNWVETETT